MMGHWEQGHGREADIPQRFLEKRISIGTNVHLGDQEDWTTENHMKRCQADKPQEALGYMVLGSDQMSIASIQRTGMHLYSTLS